MKAAAIGAFVSAVLVLMVVGGIPDIARVYATTPEYAANSDLITLTSSLGDHRQQLTIIDPKLRSIGIYHVDGASGEISLKSVRNFSWDLQLQEFNGVSPLPREIRSLLEQK
jgi:hypothetical protein